MWVLKEIREIVKACNDNLRAGKKSAIATVVHVEGSSYRRAGARMLVSENGELTGAISGGCLEGDALRKAMYVLSQQQNKLITYDTNDEEDATLGIQLGCSGIIQVLIEPINSQHLNNPIQLLSKAAAIRQKSVVVTLFSLANKRSEQMGTCLLMEANGNISGRIPFPEFESHILEDVRLAFREEKSVFRKYVGSNLQVSAFIEFLKPSVSLVVVGAGNDAISMMHIADTLGWDVRIVDGRSTHAKPERFVSACQVLVSKPEQVLEHIPIDDQTAFVMMTHNYNYDLGMLKALLGKKIPYIGLLGPKKKLYRMFDDLRNEGIGLTEEFTSRIYGPVGLEIGAENAAEISLSILAEIQAVLNGKNGGHLRLKKDEIHSRSESTWIEKKLME